MVAIFNLPNLTFMRMLRQHVVLNLLLLMKDVSLPGLSLCILLLTPSLPPNQSVFIHKYFFYHLANADRGNNACKGGGLLHSFGTTAVLEAIKSLTHVEKDCG